MRTDCKTLVVGGGIVGMAVAAGLARSGRGVILIEKMDHASACALACTAVVGDPLCMPNCDVHALACASADLLCEIPGILCEKEVLHLIPGHHPESYVDMFACCVNAHTTVAQLEPGDLAHCYPFICTGGDDCAAALCLAAQAIDAGKLYSYFRTQFVKCGGQLCYGESLVEACFGGGAWSVQTSSRKIRAEVIVNCAGAQADDVARRCDARRLSLMTLTRTCVELSFAPDCEFPGNCHPLLCWEGDALDLCCDLRAGGRVLLSCLGGDPRGCGTEPYGEQIGTVIVCLEERTSFRVRPDSGPARLCVQSFATDCRPVIGWTRETPAFYWCAGMGDFGVSCAAAAAAIACDMIQNRTDFIRAAAGYGLGMECVCPDRLGFVGVVA